MPYSDIAYVTGVPRVMRATCRFDIPQMTTGFNVLLFIFFFDSLFFADENRHACSLGDL